MIALEFSYTIKNIDKAAKFIDENIKSPVVAFYGAMGMGKTTLISALLAFWKSEDKVSSPSYSLVNEYFSKNKGKIYHFDFYRLKNSKEGLDIGIEEYFYSGQYCLLEWAEKINPYLPKIFTKFEIKGTGAERTITLLK